MDKRGNLKRVLAFLLCAAVIITYTPSAVFTRAEEASAGQEQTEAVETASDKGGSDSSESKAVEAPKAEEKAADTSSDEAGGSDTDAASEQKEDVASAETPAIETSDADQLQADTDPAAEPDKEAQAEDEEDTEDIKYPATDLTGSAGDVKVSIHAPEGALPEGTTVSVKAVAASAVEDAIKEEMGDDAEVVKAVDVTFHDKDGKEIEPKKQVSVKFVSSEFKNLDEPAVVHIKDNGSAEEVRSASVSGSQASFKVSDFSIYAVVDSGETKDDSRLLVKFMNGEDEIASMYIKKDDDMEQVLYDPGVPEVQNKSFMGWTTTKNYDSNTDGKTIQEVRTEVKSELDAGVEEGAEKTYYAMLFTTYRLYYADENETVFETEVGTTTGDEVTLTVDEAYSVSDANKGFVGWKVKGTDGSTYYRNGSSITISEDTTLVPVIEEGHWLYFDENDGGSGTGNASYTPPAFIKGGETASSAEPTEPTRPGYTFKGWFTSATGTTEFDFNKELSADTTIYAQWEAKKDSKYTVIIWMQKVTDDKNAADADKTYDFSEMYELTAASGTEITSSMISAYTGKTYKEGNNTRFKYRTYTITDGSGKATTVVGGKGDTVVNVYFDRALYTIQFYGSRSGSSPNYSYNNLQQTMTGLYGQSLTQYNYTWPSGRWYSVAFLDAFSGTLFGTSDLGGTENLIKTFPEKNTNVTIVFLTQTLNDSSTYAEAARADYQIDNWTSAYSDRNKGRFRITDRFTGMTPSGYSWSTSNTVPTSWDTSTTDGFTDTRKTSNDQKFLFIKYDRVTSDLVFMYDGSAVKTVEEIPYEKSLSSYKSEAPTISPDEGYYFAGWYEDATLTTPFDWDSSIMSTSGKIVYAKVEPVEYHVKVYPNGGNLPGGQSENFWTEYGTVLDSTNFENATWAGSGNYSLVGWYTDEACTKPWNFNARLTTDSLAIVYDGPDDPRRIDYDDDGWDATVGVFTLYAKWRDDDVATSGGITVKYINPAGAPEYSYEDNLKYADQAEVYAAAAPTEEYCPDGKQFAGWQLGSSTYFPAQTFTADKALAEEEGAKLVITLTAVYIDKETHTPTHINWYKNDGSGDIVREDKNLKINQAVTPPDAPTREGYEFLGWAKDEESKGASSSNTALLVEYDSANGYSPAQVAADEEDPYEALYAVWKEKEVTINYAVASDSTDMGFVYPTSEKVKVKTGNASGSTATAASTTYVFDYWTVDDGTESISTEAKYVPSRNDKNVYEAHTYYAHFKLNEADVTVHHYLKGTTTIVADDVTTQQIIGTEYSATPVTKYQEKDLTVDSYNPSQKVTVSADGNVITIYYTLPLSITAETKSKTYDGQPLDGEYAISGELDSDTNTIKTALGTAPSITNVADSPKQYLTKSDQSEITGIPEYYTVEYKSGTLTINKKAVTITVNNSSKVFGADDPKFTGTVEGLVNDNDLGTIEYSRTNEDEAVGVYNQVLDASYTNNDNYDVTVNKGNFEITINKTLTVTALGYEDEYDGDTHAASATALIAGKAAEGIKIEYSTDNGTTWSETAPSVKDVEEKTVKVRASKTGYETAEDTCTLKVKPKPVTVTAVADSKVYGADDPVFTAEVEGNLSGDNIVYKVTRPRAGTDENVGTYENAIVPSGNTTQGNYTVTYIPADFTITPAALTVTITGNNDTLVYNGSEQSVTGYTVSVPEGATLKESEINGPKQSDAIAKGTDVDGGSNDDKTYPMGLAETDFSTTNTNYAVTFSITDGWLKITKAKTLTVTATGYTGVYDAESHAASATPSVTNGTTIEYSTDGETWSHTAPSITNVGEQSVQVRAINPNYETATDSCKLKVTPKAVTVSAVADSKVYGESDPTFTAKVEGNLNGDVIAYTVTRPRAGKDENVGTYTGAIVASGDAAQGNYTVTYTPADFTITKAEMTVSATGYEDVYDAVSHAASASASVTDGTTIEYSTDGGQTWSENTPSIKDVGEKSVQVRATNPNYNDATANCILKVTPKAVIVAAKASNKVYGAEDPKFEAEVTGTIGEDTVAYTVTRPGAGTDENVGTYTDAIVAAGDKIQGNYTVTYTPANFEITKAGTLTVTATGYNGVYDANDHSASATANITDGTTIEYSTNGGQTWSKTAPSIKNVGEQTVQVRATNPNYNDATAECILKVTPASVMVQAIDNEKTYGETDPTLAASVSGVIDDANIDYSLDRDPGEDAGTYKITPSGEATQGNYIVRYETGTFTIHKATMAVTAVNYSGVYDGETHKGGATTSVTEGTSIMYSTDDGETWSDEVPSITNVGTVSYQVKATNKNYEDASANGTLTVTPKAVTVTAEDKSKVYGANDPVLTATVEGTLGNDTVSYDMARDPGENVGNYTITPSGQETQGNYIVEYETGKLTITVVDISDDNDRFEVGAVSDVVYNGNEQKQSVTITDTTTKKALIEGTDYDLSYSDDVTNVGKVTVTITGKGNYTGSFDRTYNITPAPLTVTADDKAKVYGSNDPVLTAKVTGLKGNDTFQKDVDFTISRDAGEDVGTYTITPEEKANLARRIIRLFAASSDAKEIGNYSVKFVEGTLTITQAPLTITTGSASRAYNGAALTNRTASISGLVNGDSATVTATGSQTAVGSSRNTYSISWASGKADNYTITESLGTLTVTAAPTPTPTPTPDDDDDDDDDATPAGGGGGGNAGGGGGAGAPAVAPAAPAGTTIADNPTPQAEPETIIDDPTPQAAPEGTWALLNLIAAALTALGAVVALFRKKEDDDEDGGDDDDNRGRKMLASKIAGAVAGIAAPVTFFLTENMSQQMAMVDKWTVLMALLLAAQIVTAVINKKASEAEDSDEAENA